MNCPGHGIFPSDMVTHVMDAVCKVKYQNLEKGTGFFGVICDRRKGFQLHGLFTNNHILDYPDLDEKLEATCILYREGRKWPLTLSKNNFCFTCRVLDATFISLTQQQVEEVKKYATFLQIRCGAVDSNTSGEEMGVMVVQYPHCGPQGQSHGKITKDMGCDFFHNASTEEGSSGSPVVDTRGNVVGIHKGYDDADNVAVKLQHVVDAVVKDHERGPTLIPKEPISFKKHAEKERILIKHGLVRAIENEPMVFRLENHEIWFERTAHFWYWTFDEPHPKERRWYHWRKVVQKLSLDGVVDEHRAIIQFLRDSGDKFL